MRDRLLPIKINVSLKILTILAIESGIGDSWHKLLGKKVMITMESFGLSGTGSDVMNHFGFSVSNIKKNINKLIKKNR